MIPSTYVSGLTPTSVTFVQKFSGGLYTTNEIKITTNPTIWAGDGAVTCTVDDGEGVSETNIASAGSVGPLLTIIGNYGAWSTGNNGGVCALCDVTITCIDNLAVNGNGGATVTATIFTQDTSGNTIQTAGTYGVPAYTFIGSPGLTALHSWDFRNALGAVVVDAVCPTASAEYKNGSANDHSPDGIALDGVGSYIKLNLTSCAMIGGATTVEFVFKFIQFNPGVAFFDCRNAGGSEIFSMQEREARTRTTAVAVAANCLTFAAAHGIAHGTPVVYNATSTSFVVGLTIGTTYYAHLYNFGVPTAATVMKLSATATGPALSIAGGGSCSNVSVSRCGGAGVHISTLPGAVVGKIVRVRVRISIRAISPAVCAPSTAADRSYLAIAQSLTIRCPPLRTQSPGFAYDPLKCLTTGALNLENKMDSYSSKTNDQVCVSIFWLGRLRAVAFTRSSPSRWHTLLSPHQCEQLCLANIACLAAANYQSGTLGVMCIQFASHQTPSLWYPCSECGPNENYADGTESCSWYAEKRISGAGLPVQRTQLHIGRVSFFAYDPLKCLTTGALTLDNNMITFNYKTNDQVRVSIFWVGRLRAVAFAFTRDSPSDGSPCSPLTSVSDYVSPTPLAWRRPTMKSTTA